MASAPTPEGLQAYPISHDGDDGVASQPSSSRRSSLDRAGAGCVAAEVERGDGQQPASVVVSGSPALPASPFSPLPRAPGRLLCGGCNRQFATQAALLQHQAMTQHSGTRPDATLSPLAPAAQAEAGGMATMASPMVAVAPGGVGLRCGQCNRQFASQASLLQHQAMTQHVGVPETMPAQPQPLVHAEQPTQQVAAAPAPPLLLPAAGAGAGRLLCGGCNRQYDTQAALLQHQAMTQHNGVRGAVQAAGVAQVAGAAPPLLAPPQQLAGDVVAAAPATPAGAGGAGGRLLCGDCNRQFGTLAALQQHHAMTQHNGVRHSAAAFRLALSAQGAGSEGVASESLAAAGIEPAMIGGAGERLLCGQCNRQYGTQGALLQHQAMTGHTGARHAAAQAAPAAAFPQPAGLGEAPSDADAPSGTSADAAGAGRLMCAQCNRQFKSQAALQVHHIMTQHTGQRELPAAAAALPLPAPAPVLAPAPPPPQPMALAPTTPSGAQPLPPFHSGEAAALMTSLAGPRVDVASMFQHMPASVPPTEAAHQIMQHLLSFGLGVGWGLPTADMDQQAVKSEQAAATTPPR